MYMQILYLSCFTYFYLIVDLWIVSTSVKLFSGICIDKVCQVINVVFRNDVNTKHCSHMIFCHIYLNISTAYRRLNILIGITKTFLCQHFILTRPWSNFSLKCINNSSSVSTMLELSDSQCLQLTASTSYFFMSWKTSYQKKSSTKGGFTLHQRIL